MTTTNRKPAYAQAKTITSRSGADATSKHIKSLEKARQLLLAQDFADGLQASRMAVVVNVIEETINNYRSELRTYYYSDHNPYRR